VIRLDEGDRVVSVAKLAETTAARARTPGRTTAGRPPAGPPDALIAGWRRRGQPAPGRASGAAAHQEGVIGLVAVIGLGLKDGHPIAGLAPQGPLGWSILIGALVGSRAAARSG